MTRIDEINICAYCGASHRSDIYSEEDGTYSNPPRTVPRVDDEDAWADLARHHEDWCEWVSTRAHRLED